MKSTSIKRLISFVLSVIMIVSTVFVANAGVSVDASEVAQTTYAETSVWSGKAAASFASGSGTQTDPYIIATADQLYLALTQITDTVNSVAGGKQTSEMLKQDSTTEYVPVYTSNYYKVADGVNAFYLNNITGKESLQGIKNLVNGSDKKEWKTGKPFVGNLDGNGVTIYGMYSATGQGLIYKLDGSAVVKNINFNSCYSSGSGNAAMVTTMLGHYSNDTTIHTIANISVRNSYIASTRNITLTTVGSDGYYQYLSGAAGIVSTSNTCENLNLINCLYDGYSCERVVKSTAGITADMIGGIISGGYNMNNVTLNGCVSLGAPAVDEVYITGKEVFYNRYDKNQGFQVRFYSSYTDIPCKITEAYPNKYDRLSDIGRISKQPDYNIYDFAKLDLRTDWYFVTVYDGLDTFGTASRVIPMPKVNNNVSAEMLTYPLLIAQQNNGGGAYSIFGGAYYRGTYGMYHDLYGSGTAEDPYIIQNAFELARAIASGGVNVYNKLYYKLVCDIDASEAAWITQDSHTKSGINTYQYVEFNGVLDGNGYSVSGIFAGDDNSVGLIPVLGENGVVKNIHIRDSFFVSGSKYAGAVAGETKTGAVIEECSVENCVVASKSDNSHIVGDGHCNVKNSYYIADEESSAKNKTAYYNAEGNIGDIDVKENSDIWYLGGKEGSLPKLKNYAETREFVDIDGDGAATEYSAADLVALRRAILQTPGYEYINGDINRDGKINITDIAVLSRIIVGSYDKIYDGFWRNAALGKISIYYGENDNYDAARRLELYLEEELSGTDIQKVVSADKTVSGTTSDSSAVYVHSNDKVGKPKGQLEIVVGNIQNYGDYATNTLDTNDYAITYDEENGVLWFKGGSFTGVEQAVIDFIQNSDSKTNSIYTVQKATLATEKQAKTVMVDTDYDGKADTQKTFYYAWGDEFDGVKDADDGENAQISVDTWNHARMRTETEVGKSGNYNNVETANENEIDKLYWVEDGKLKITRGVKSEYATAETDKLGYARLYEQYGTTALGDSVDDDDVIANPGLIKTNHSMLWKQGYAEMYASLPSDGHTFASWWMLGHGVINNSAMDETLYSKVYKLNNAGEYAYDGTSVWPTSTDPKTYKYQVPTNHFEIDIWELMQNPSLKHPNYKKTETTGTYEYRLYLNVHKFYAVGARSQSVVNVIDWNNPSTPRAVMQKSWFGNAEDDYYFSTSAAYLDLTDGTNTRMTKDILGRVTARYAEKLQQKLTAPRRYGFYWSTNGVDKFNFTLYIYDINGDGVEDDNAILGTSDMTYDTQDGMNPQNYDCVNDAEVANQYMYFLIDNILYTSNPTHNNSTSDNAAMHTDMLVDNGTAANPDKISLDIDYVRVYQLDGRRDIITRETEDFNNGNHFGY